MPPQLAALLVRRLLAQMRRADCRAMSAFSVPGSTGRRNTGVKSLCWCFELQGLTWSFV
jgi:hypothetical protein